MQSLLTSHNRRKKPAGLDFISWTTVRYRSVALLVTAVFLLGVVVASFIFPEAAKAAWNAVSSRIANRAAKIGTGTSSQAHFTYIDGAVKIRKSNSNNWITATYDTGLEKGDVVQTTTEGMAKIVFTDGTNYTVKQDSLIVVEENSTNKEQQTNVAVQVSTGTVDLSTATFTQGSKSEVRVAGASASLAPESSASVRSDPAKDQHEIMLKKGSADVVKGGEIVKLADFEKVAFKSDNAKKMERGKAVLAPILVSPSNMSPIFMGGDGGNVQFTWTAVTRGKNYHFRLSRNPYFTALLLDRQLDATNLAVTGLAQGAYYWEVQAVDEDGKESVESEKNRFTIVPKTSSKVALALNLKEFAQHGHVIEVVGDTEAGARVMVNGQEVPVIGSDGTFHYFTPPLPQGENVITVTAQNSKGGVNTKQHTVVIQ